MPRSVTWPHGRGPLGPFARHARRLTRERKRSRPRASRRGRRLEPPARHPWWRCGPVVRTRLGRRVRRSGVHDRASPQVEKEKHEDLVEPDVVGLHEVAGPGGVIAQECRPALTVSGQARRPQAGALVARARIIKEGKRLIVGDVSVAHEGREDAPVAHAVMTYSVPPGGA
jgi:hypothetical protein